MIRVQKISSISKIIDPRGLLCFYDIPAFSGFSGNVVEVFSARDGNSAKISLSSSVIVLILLICGSIELINETDAGQPLRLDSADSSYLVRSDQSLTVKSHQPGSTAMLVFYNAE